MTLRNQPVWRQWSWHWQVTGGVTWAADQAFQETGLVCQGFSGRQGGVSGPQRDALNISYAVGDDPESVGENRRRLAAAGGFALSGWSGLRQVHGRKVVQVTPDQTGVGALDPTVPLIQADGQMTNCPGVVLVTQHADCIPLYFLDPVHQAIGLAHAGWQGTLLDIAGAMVAGMVAAFGSRPADLLAAVGPGAGPCHYEVDEPVLAKVHQCFAQAPEMLPVLLRPAPLPDRAYLDLGLANAYLLWQQGIPAGQISLSGICTMCCPDRLFSHRMGDWGRQAAFLGLMDKKG